MDPQCLQRLLDTQATLVLSLVGSLLLSFGSCCTQGFACALHESVSPVCVGSGGSMVGLMATSSNRPYATPRSAAPRAPAPAAGHCRPIPPQETCKQSKAVPSQPLQDLLVYTRFCLSPLSVSAGYGFDSKCNFAPPTVFALVYDK